MERKGLGALVPRAQSDASLAVSARSSKSSMSPSLPLPSVMRVRIFEHLPQAFPAGDALAAGFIRQELDEVAGDVDQAGVLVHDDHAARSHHRAGLGELVEADRKIQQGLGKAASRGPAGLHGLEFLAAGIPPPIL